MFRQDRTNPSSAVSNWKGRRDTAKAWSSTAVSSWLNGGLFSAGFTACPDYTAGASNRAGYCYGGVNYLGEAGQDSASMRCHRLAYSDETQACFAITQPGQVTAGGFANSGTAGYAALGYADGASVSTVVKCAFATDAVSTLASGQSTARRNTLGAVALSGTAGYQAGGYGTSPTYSDVIDKWSFSDDSRSTLSATLPRAKYGTAGCANSISNGYGYFWGGYGTAYGSPTNQGFFQEITFLAFNGESTGTLSATIPLYSNLGTYQMSGMQNKNSAVYACGGYIGPLGVTAQTRIMKVTTSTATFSTLTPTLSVGRRDAGGHSNDGTAGYASSGVGSTDAGWRTTDKLTFSGDTVSTLASELTYGTQYSAGFANTSGL